jgi:hypothetical protein
MSAGWYCSHMALLGELVFVAQVYVLLTVLDIYWVLRQVAVTSAYLIRQRKLCLVD